MNRNKKAKTAKKPAAPDFKPRRTLALAERDATEGPSWNALKGSTWNDGTWLAARNAR